jgi:hypothetical protein
MSNYEEDEEEATTVDKQTAMAIDDTEDQVDPYFDPDSDLNDFAFDEDVSLDKNEEDSESY